MLNFDAFGPAECEREWEIAALPGGPVRPWILVERGTTRPYTTADGKRPRRFASYDAAARFLARLCAS